MRVKRIVFSSLLVLVSALGFSLPLFAKPEHLQIKSEEEKEREAEAEALAKSIDLTKVEDPDARLALEAVLRMMGLDKRAAAENKKRAEALRELQANQLTQAAPQAR